MVETIARGSDADEIAVARRAIELARRATDSNSSAATDPVSTSTAGEPRGHVGFYLVDRGQAELKAAFGYRPGWRERLFEWVLGHPDTVYFGAIAVLLADVRSLGRR